MLDSIQGWNLRFRSSTCLLFDTLLLTIIIIDSSLLQQEHLQHTWLGLKRIVFLVILEDRLHLKLITELSSLCIWSEHSNPCVNLSLSPGPKDLESMVEVLLITRKQESDVELYLVLFAHELSRIESTKSVCTSCTHHIEIEESFISFSWISNIVERRF